MRFWLFIFTSIFRTFVAFLPITHNKVLFVFSWNFDAFLILFLRTCVNAFFFKTPKWFVCCITQNWWIVVFRKSLSRYLVFLKWGELFLRICQKVVREWMDEENTFLERLRCFLCNKNGKWFYFVPNDAFSISHFRASGLLLTSLHHFQK